MNRLLYSAHGRHGRKNSMGSIRRISFTISIVAIEGLVDDDVSDDAGDVEDEIYYKVLTVLKTTTIQLPGVSPTYL